MESTVLDKVKVALRVTTSAFDEEIQDLIDAAKADLGIVAQEVDTDDPLIFQAVKTYCRLHFGQPDDYDKLERSYWHQKAQIRSHIPYRFTEVDVNG